MEIKKYNVKFKDKRQLDRYMFAKDEEEVKKHFSLKYPHRIIVLIEEIKNG